MGCLSQEEKQTHILQLCDSSLCLSGAKFGADYVGINTFPQIFTVLLLQSKPNFALIFHEYSWQFTGISDRNTISSAWGFLQSLSLIIAKGNYCSYSEHSSVYG